MTHPNGPWPGTPGAAQPPTGPAPDALPSATPVWSGSAALPAPPVPSVPLRALVEPQVDTRPTDWDTPTASNPRRALPPEPEPAVPQPSPAPAQGGYAYGPYAPAPVAPGYAAYPRPAAYPSAPPATAYPPAPGPYRPQPAPYGPPSGFAPPAYSPAPPFAAQTSYTPAAPSSYGQPYAAPAYAPSPYAPSQYGQPTGLYGPPGSYGYGPHSPYPQPPARRRGLRALLVLLAIAVVAGVAVPVVNALTGPTYQNTSYTPPEPNTNPPALPNVVSTTQAKQVTESSSLYSQSIPVPTKCTVTSIDLVSASDSELSSHMNGVVACLMRVWDGPVTSAGYLLPRPPVVVYSSSITSACGKMTMTNASYCGSDQKIYYATDLPKAIPSDLRSSRFIVEMIVAHEFGHAVQARTSILTAGHGLEDAAGTSAAEREMSRRIELQADCFAGLFIRSVSRSAGMTQADLDNLAALMTSFGDDSQSSSTSGGGSHGTGANRRYWAQLGLASTTVAACNTFTAAADLVR